MTQEPSRPPKSNNRAWKELFVIFLMAVVGYLPSLWNGFVYDDERYILANPLVSGPLDLGRIFSESFPPASKDQGLYRPLITLSAHIDFRCWGFASTGQWNGFHLTNLLFHALNACLFLLLLRRLGMTRPQRVVSSLIFALHPLLSEAVAWIVGRAELLAMTFGLLALHVFLRSCSLSATRRFLGWAGMFLLWLAALLCKEHWLVFPGFAALLLFCFPTLPRPSRRSLFQLGFFAVLIGGLFWGIRFAVIGSWHPPISAYGQIPTFDRISTALAVLWRYVGLWFWPIPLSVHHEIHPVENIASGLGLIATWLTILWLAWRWRFGYPWFTLAVGWFWIGMLTVSNLIIPIGAISGERFAYLGTLFFAPALVVGGQRISNLMLPSPVRRPLSVGLIVLICGLLFGRLWIRLEDWQTNLALWTSSLALYPESYPAKANLAISLLEEGRYNEAHVLAAEALFQSEQNPQPYQQHFNPRLIKLDAAAQSGMRQMIWLRQFRQANAAARHLQPQIAMDLYRKLAIDFPDQYLTHEAMGDLYMRLKNPVAAYQRYAEARRLGGKSPQLLSKSAQNLSELGSKAEALMLYEESLRINPNDAVTHYNRGVILGELGDFPAALDAFRAANRIIPQLAAPHLNAAAILIHLKHYNEAREELDMVFAVNPKQPEALELLRKIPGASRVLDPGVRGEFRHGAPSREPSIYDPRP